MVLERKNTSKILSTVLARYICLIQFHCLYKGGGKEGCTGEDSHLDHGEDEEETWCLSVLVCTECRAQRSGEKCSWCRGVTG